MREVQNKWNTLKMNDDIWAKLIYFEQNRRLAKAYVSAPVLTIDGSTNGLDGFRIGLSGIDNSYRGLDSIACLRSIGQGIKLKIDSQGNILMRKIGPSNGSKTTFDQCSVWVKDWPSVSSLTANNLSSSDLSSASSSGASSSNLNKENNNNWHMREIEETDVSYKIFDMNKFRLQLERRRNLTNGNPNLSMDWRQCVSIISFVRTRHLQNQSFANTDATSKSPQKTILRDPCWLMLINIIAIDMLKSSIHEARNNSKATPGQQTIPKPDYMSPQELNMAHKPSSRASSRKTILDYDPFMDPNHKQLRASSSIASLYSAQQQPATGRSSQLELDRLSRLNNSRHGNRLSTGGLGPFNDLPLSTARPYSSTQHLGYSNDYGNNVIYTTFTGKYTNQSNRNNKSSYLADYSSTSDYNSTSKSSNYAMKTKTDQQKRQNSPSNYHYSQLYPLDQTSRLPFVKSHELGSRSKSQSLSNFDWSHQNQSQRQPRRLIDLRSVKSSSIKMNFDDDDDDDGDDDGKNHNGQHNDEDDDHRQVGNDQNGRSGTPQVAQTKYGRKSSFPMQQNTSVSSRRAIISMNKDMSSWSFPPQARDVDGHKTSGHKSPSVGVKQTSLDEVPDVINEEEEHDLHQQPREDKNDQQQQTNLAKLKVSRSSIGSTHSSSSGCPENDYFISNSSSSMSSSTGSHECELFSQPASSSGIVCSGNTSDEYELDARNKKQANNGNNNINKKDERPTTDYNQPKGDDGPKKTRKDSSVQSTDYADDNKAKLESAKKHSRCPAVVGPNSRQNIRAISKSRCYNVKTVDIAEGETNDLICSHYNPNQSCDCDVANGQQRRPNDTNACDCCCDCLVDVYQTPPVPIETNIQVDRCDCGHLESRNNYGQDNDDHDCGESIYERLPRPGKPSYVSGNRGRLTRRSINVGSNQHARTLERSASSMVNVIEDDGYDDIQALPLPAQNVDPKRATLKDMKQSNSTSWLERRKYIKLFPKFMFSSASSSSSTNNNDSMKQTGAKLDSKSAADSKFRRTRSSQNLMTR